MGCDVSLYAASERVLAQELLEHAEHRRALLVRQGVEHLFRFSRRTDLRADRPRRGECIHAEWRLLVPDEFRPGTPVRAPVVHDLAGEPRGERLVQPQIVPPLHRDEIAEPLVDDLMGDYIGYGAQRT